MVRFRPAAAGRGALRLAPLLVLSACASRGAALPAAAPPPMRDVEVPAVGDEEGLVAATALLDELGLDHPRRAAVRAAAQSYLFGEMDAALARDRLGEAFDRFAEALALYEPAEIDGDAGDGRGAALAAARRIRAAFAPRGGENEVATALAVEIALAEGRDAAARARREQEQLFSWLDEVAALDRGSPAELLRVIEVLEEVAARFPSADVRGRLTERYLGLHARFARLGDGRTAGWARARLGLGGVIRNLGYLAARWHVFGDDPRAALDLLRRLEGWPGDDPPLRERLVRVVGAAATADDAVALAQRFEASDPDMAERVCVRAARRDRGSAAAWGCAAQFAARQGDPRLAIARLERAVALDARRDWYQALVGLRLTRLADLVRTERLADAEKEARRIETLDADAAARWPDGWSAGQGASLAMFHLGEGYYWAGDLARARPLFERFLETSPTSEQAPDAAYKLALVRARSLGAAEAAAHLAGVAAQLPPRWSARLLAESGEALAEAGRHDEARKVLESALRVWDALRAQTADDEDALAQIEFARGRVLYALGRRDEALGAIRGAVDVKPDHRATYVDAIAFLATRGEIEEAHDAYLRAMGVESLDDYARIYISAWIYDLGRRLGRPVPVAERFLREVEGREWHHEVARFVSGRISYGDASGKADTRGKRAELSFYEAQRRLAAGQVEEARALWREVLASDMLAFYEFEMAKYYLRKFGP